jgi:hypothetical protein
MRANYRGSENGRGPLVAAGVKPGWDLNPSLLFVLLCNPFAWKELAQGGTQGGMSLWSLLGLWIGLLPFIALL